VLCNTTERQRIALYSVDDQKQEKNDGRFGSGTCTGRDTSNFARTLSRDIEGASIARPRPNVCISTAEFGN